MIPLITHKAVPAWIKAVKLSGLSPLLLGDVGIGKSDSVLKYCEEEKLEPVIIYLDSMYEMDIIGYATPDKEKGIFEYLPCGLFPLENTPLPKGKKGFAIILEEFGNCPKSMQVAAQRIIYDKRVGDNALHPKAQIILLGNKVSSGANAIPLSAAVRTRCAIAELDSKSSQSSTDAIDYMNSKNYHPLLMSWIANNKHYLRDPDVKLRDDGESPMFTHRGFGAVSKMMNRLQAIADKKQRPITLMLNDQIALFQSLIGYTAGAELYADIMSPVSGLEEIYSNPTSAQIPTNASTMLKTASFICANTKTDDEHKSLNIYLNRVSPETRSALKTKIKNSKPSILLHEVFVNATFGSSSDSDEPPFFKATYDNAIDSSAFGITKADKWLHGDWDSAVTTKDTK